MKLKNVQKRCIHSLDWITGLKVLFSYHLYPDLTTKSALEIDTIHNETYCITGMIRGRKHSRMIYYFLIREKTFAIIA